MMKRFFDAYVSIYPLSREEVNKGLTLFYLKSFYGVWSESEYYLKGNQRVKTFFPMEMVRAKYLINNLSEFEKILSN